jgi:hypothetical protein
VGERKGRLNNGEIEVGQSMKTELGEGVDGDEDEDEGDLDPEDKKEYVEESYGG